MTTLQDKLAAIQWPKDIERIGAYHVYRGKYTGRSTMGSWREQVAGCPVTRCGLWPVRPSPYSGPLADPPRDPATVDRGWVRHAVGLANSGHPEEL